MDAGAMFLGAGAFTKLRWCSHHNLPSTRITPDMSLGISQLIIRSYLIILKALHLVAAALPPDGRSILYPGRYGWPS
jgi:hypothetical protein